MTAKHLKVSKQSAALAAPTKTDQPRRNNLAPEHATQQPVGRKRHQVSGRTRAGSKQDEVVALLSRPEGASLAAVMKITGWQKHSVHGFFSGVLRKKLKLKLERIGEGDKAAYRITRGKQISAPASARKPQPARAERPRQGKQAR